MDGRDEDIETQQNKRKLRWTDQVENVLISMADKAIVYKVLHEKAYKINKIKNYGFTIPCVCLSTLLASATFALSGDSKLIPQENMVFAQYGLGGVNILIGILQTLQNFFKYAQMSEAHDSVSKQWYKLHRMINTELNLARNKRKDADEFMKYTQLEFDRLIDLSPDIPENIIKKFKESYLKKADLANSRIKDKDSVASVDLIELPDICGTISHTRAYRADDIEEVVEKPEDPFDSLVRKITNQLAATSYIVGAGANIEGDKSTVSSAPVSPSTILPMNMPEPVNKTDIRIDIDNIPPVKSGDNKLELPNLPPINTEKKE